jgi:hypothetical protein
MQSGDSFYGVLAEDIKNLDGRGFLMAIAPRLVDHRDQVHLHAAPRDILVEERGAFWPLPTRIANQNNRLTNIARPLRQISVPI